MGRLPCCDKVGIKKGPWTPEEDIILASYIQEHGPGNWRSVPTNTGLMRCSKSCRLRWTNYLRPGIKRGNFTPHEEEMIIQLQGLLGNRWATIASHLPQRTDNDIKNYWNTHLIKKKKMIKQLLPPPQAAAAPATSCNMASDHSSAAAVITTSTRQIMFDVHNNINDAAAKSTSDHDLQYYCSFPRHINNHPYASSAENISRLLEAWMRSTPAPPPGKLPSRQDGRQQPRSSSSSNNNAAAAIAAAAAAGAFQGPANGGGGGDGNCSFVSQDVDELESLLSFENVSGGGHGSHPAELPMDAEMEKRLMGSHYRAPFSMLETWLLGEAAGDGEEDLADM